MLLLRIKQFYWLLFHLIIFSEDIYICLNPVKFFLIIRWLKREKRIKEIYEIFFLKFWFWLRKDYSFDHVSFYCKQCIPILLYVLFYINFCLQ